MSTDESLILNILFKKIFDMALDPAISHPSSKGGAKEARGFHLGHYFFDELIKVVREDKIRIIKCPNTCYNARLNTLEVNFEQLSTSRIGCVLGKARMFMEEEGGRTDLGEFYKIGSCPNPPEITLAHELIHALHYLRILRNLHFYEAKACRTDSAPSGGISGGSVGNAMPESLRARFEARRPVRASTVATATPARAEGSERERALELFRERNSCFSRAIEKIVDDRLWKAREEYETVIGSDFFSDYHRCDTSVLGEMEKFISENGFRLASGLQPRYAYQRHDENFFEEPTVLDKNVFFGLSPEEVRIILDTLPSRKGSTFDSAKALSSINSFKKR